MKTVAISVFILDCGEIRDFDPPIVFCHPGSQRNLTIVCRAHVLHNDVNTEDLWWHEMILEKIRETYTIAFTASQSVSR